MKHDEDLFNHATEARSCGENGEGGRRGTGEEEGEEAHWGGEGEEALGRRREIEDRGLDGGRKGRKGKETMAG